MSAWEATTAMVTSSFHTKFDFCLFVSRVKNMSKLFEDTLQQNEAKDTVCL